MGTKRKTQPNVTKDDVIGVHTEHPDWTPPQIARELGCDSAFVRAMKQRHKIPIPSFDREAYSIGVHAKSCGISIKDIDLIKGVLR